MALLDVEDLLLGQLLDDVPGQHDDRVVREDQDAAAGVPAFDVGEDRAQP